MIFLPNCAFSNVWFIQALCTVLTVIQYFFHTAIFTWMLVEGINLYIKLVKVFSVKKQYVAYVALGWGKYPVYFLPNLAIWNISEAQLQKLVRHFLLLA